MKRLILACLATALAVPSVASAAGVGNPASTIGSENYGFTMEVEDQKKTVDMDAVESRRYLGKAVWGATDRLDIYARFGTSDIKVKVLDGPDFKGSQGMTYGGGARLRLVDIEIPKLLAFVDVQGLSYDSKGEVLVASSEGEDTWVDRFEAQYRWNEVQFSFCTVWDRDVWKPYGGFTITNVFGHVDKNHYRITGGLQSFMASESNDFREDAIPELLLGIDIALGGTGRLSGELRLNEDDLSFFIGLSELYR